MGETTDGVKSSRKSDQSLASGQRPEPHGESRRRYYHRTEASTHCSVPTSASASARHIYTGYLIPDSRTTNRSVSWESMGFVFGAHVSLVDRSIWLPVGWTAVLAVSHGRGLAFGSIHGLGGCEGRKGKRAHIQEGKR